MKNGEAINTRRAAADALGVRATGDRVLEVEFENPIAYFDKLVASQTYLPDPRGFLQEPQRPLRAPMPRTCSSTGRSVTRELGARRAACGSRRTRHYWNRDCDQAQRDRHRRTSRATRTARLNLFQDGRVADVDYLPRRGARPGAAAALAAAPLTTTAACGICELNFGPGRVTANYHLRKALQLANDPAELVYKVLKMPSYHRGGVVVPRVASKASTVCFAQEYPPPRVTTGHRRGARAPRAREARAWARRSFPPLVLLSDDTPAADHALGVPAGNLRAARSASTIRIDRQIFRQRLAKQEAGEFDHRGLRLGSRLRRPVDVRRSVRVVESQQPRPLQQPRARRAGAHRAAVARSERAHDAFAEIQRIIIEDAVIVLDYERGVMYVQDPRLKGVVRARSVGSSPTTRRPIIVEDP